MAKIKVPNLEASTFKGWTFVLVAGVVLALLALLDRGTFGATATGSTGCVMTVAAAQLNVRPTPGTESAPVDTLKQGDQVDAQRVVTNGFRQLAGTGRWALDQSLVPRAGSSC
ncbi:SH3 domain-containing protein [Pseudonocardia acidicola]|uniref:SH3 domain-containing protein n=1 Tax=Pseudonocardia acidicola TaxID=2724939 RepID=A0ABX1SDT4_9PSEU|nr:SH3 domain-containing protein [Pseudonocardia acidicola]NMH99074.1 SH3 domain-containing protein [Pseudonocardia acidicola]